MRFLSKKFKYYIQIIVGVLVLMGWITAHANNKHAQISIIIDDLGGTLNESLRAARLPGPVVCSILPHRPFTKITDEKAKENNKEVLLHLPMQAIRHNDLGKGGLTLDMDKQTFLQVVESDVNCLSHIQGVNNHMGSRLTMDKQSMAWLMEYLDKHHLYFLDSRTSPRSVAEKAAQEQALPTLHRDVFLDNEPTHSAIHTQFQELIQIAKKRGYAVAIGHPHPVTLRYLETVIPKLEEQGIKLVALSDLIAYTLKQKNL